MVGNPTPLVVPSFVALGGTLLQFVVPPGWLGSHPLTVTNTIGVLGSVTSYWTFTKT
jgi:hypothetical protein